MKLATKVISLVALCLFAASLFIGAPTVPAENSGEDFVFSNLQATKPESTVADYPFNFTQVSWDQQIINEQREEEWNSTGYRFGPTVNWHTRNSTDNAIIAWDQEIPLGSWVDFIVEIPYTAVSGQVPFAVAIMGSYYNLSRMVDGKVSSSDENPIGVMALYYVSENKWEIYSSKVIDMPEAPPSSLPENFTLSDVFGPMVEPFAEIDDIGSSYEAGSEAYWGRFRLLFNSSTLPGFYMLNAIAMDSNFQQLAQSQQTQQSGRLLGLNLNEIVNSAFGGYYVVSRIGDDGEILYTANRGVDFNITMTVTNATLMDNATIHMSAPSNIKVQRWVYGPYQETHVRVGAWEWNEAAGTYIWNASVEVTWSEPKEGYHWEKTYTWLNMGKEYFFYYPFGEGSGIRQTWPEYAISYDFESSSWMYSALYYYQNYTWVNDRWEYIEWQEYESWSPELPTPFILNETTSGVYVNVTSGKLMVTFRGHINEEMLPSGGENGQTLRFSERLYTLDGQQLVNFVNLPIASPQQALDYEDLRELAIDSPVSVVRLTHADEPYNPSWIFQADIGDTFTVSSRLQGGIDYADDIDGIGFIMYGHQERWGREVDLEWSQYSDIQIQVKVSPTGTIEVNVYNYTVRTSWGFGEHYEWINKEIAPGIWQPEKILITDYFWQERIWDFAANDWTDQHYPMESLRAKMPVSCLSAGNVSYFIIGDDLKVSFDITPEPAMPALEWWWEYFYGNLTWVTDYESGWGSHTVLGWTEDTVYHYWNGTQIVYVEQPFKARVFHNTQTDEVYERRSVPFVMIAGKPVWLKSYVFGDKDSTYETLIREEYDYVLEDYRHFIRFVNGTELEVFGDQTAPLYNVTLANGTWFLSFQSDPYYIGAMDMYSMIADDSSFIAMTWPEWSGYTSVRVGVVPVAKIDYTYVTYAAPIYPYEPFNTKPLYMIGWPESVGYDHWIIRLNGTLEPLDVWRCSEPGFEYLYMYFNPHDGRYYVFEWPWELMRCGEPYSDVFIPRYLTRLFAYVTVGGTNYPIPKAGEPMSGWYDLDWIIRSRYSQEIAYVNGSAYVAKKILDMYGYPINEVAPDPLNVGYDYAYQVYQVNVSNTMYNLTDWGKAPYYFMNYDIYSDQMPWVTRANGSLFISEVLHNDWTVAVGHRNQATLEFEVTDWLNLVTGDYSGDYYSSQINSYNSTGGYAYVMTVSGEEFFSNSTWRAVFHEITLSNGTFFYSRMDHPQIWPTDVSNHEIDTYYMIDIFGNYQWWNGWDEFSSQVIMIENVTGNLDDGFFWFQESLVPVIQYNVSDWRWDGSMWYEEVHEESSVWGEYYFFLQAMNGTKYEIIPLSYTPESYRYNFPSWNFTYGEAVYNITGRSDMIYKAYRFEGYSQKLDYAPLPVSIIREQDRIVTGAPKSGLWGIDLWTVEPDTGALDLDGNLDTTNDQYFVREYHSSTDWYNVTHEYLDVAILWDPDNSTWADEFSMHSFTGMVTFNWTSSWEDSYIWTKASSGETLSPAELGVVKEALLDEWGNSRPGYWGIAWLAQNFTSDDLIQKAIEEGWKWAVGTSREWSWLWWELDEHYSTEISNGTDSELMDINLAYQYAGMFAWQDENNDNFMNVSVESLSDSEMTHYWMPVDVESVSFVTPGAAFGNYNPTDSIYLGVNETVDFGVTFENVTGIVYPFGAFSYWDWYVGQYYGSDFANFNERPTECSVDEFSLAVHFTGIVNETGSNIAEVKFDICVGQWDPDTPGGTDVLENMSLAVSFYSDLSIVSGGGGGGAVATYIGDDGQILDNEVASASSNFTITSGISSVAMMSLGGAPYSWSKNASQTCIVDAQTVPLSAVSAIYVSGSGGTATSFSVTSEQFYTLIGFKWWDGWAVTVDPVFVGYISHGTTDTVAPAIGTVTHVPLKVTGVDNAHIEAMVTDSGGSELAGVKVHDIDNNENYSMTYIEGLGRWVVNIPRTQDGRYTFNYQIIASDNAGNVGVTAPRAFPFRDNIAPTITTLTWDNSTDGYGNEVAVISTQVADTGGSGIDQVFLTYSNASGYFNVTMTLDAGYYEGAIPNHAPSTTVSFWITVTDVDDNFLESAVSLFTFYSGGLPDTYGPSMSMIAHDPASPSPTDTVTISATVIDPSGTDYVTLQYKIGTGAWTNATMAADGNTWSGTIPAQADGTNVTYRLVAMDSLGNEAISSEFSYTVMEPLVTTTTTTATTTTGTGTGTILGDSMFLMIAAIGGLLVVVIILVALRKRS